MTHGAPVWRDVEITAVRELLAQLRDVENGPGGWEDRRTGMDAFGAAAKLPDGLAVESVDIAGLEAELLTPAGAAPNRALLYLHGGGYCVGSPRSHRPLAARLASAIGCPALVPHYRLAPEHRFPAAVDDAVKAYRHLLGEGVEPGRIIIAGDSAGGGLTIATAIAIRDSGLPQPAGLFAISPWANLAQTGAAYAAVLHDPMLTREGLQDMADAYLQGEGPGHPLASPALADLHDLPPMLIHAGSQEILASDATLLAERAGLAGVEVRVEIWPEMIHVWHAFAEWLGAGRRAIEEAGVWARGKLA
ncbi:alpha/beta hydrolase [Caulobacter mirabilis]|uniref:Alpha/beta hydrolase n=1 Tax=Caulobacter mirabilis TaxID=69666 RepID=A0A2D2B2Q2_9CAUL|nr:alpha/beta hydrolase [Caulobacter mirabilis]ATQ44507.1 alpha/beta hydrolase [Caulobacter mirabilis]